MSVQPWEDRAPAALAPTPTVHNLAEWAQAADAAYTMAQRLVTTSFVPEGFRGKPAEATAAILAGTEVGLSPMAALRSFDVIQGTAAPRAITLRAIVQSRGHEIVLKESTETRAIVAGRRAGTNVWQESRWTLDRAKQLGLTGKKNWQGQPGAMLVARATSECCRLIAADAILGLPYSAEEVADGFAEQAPEPTPIRRTARRAQPAPEGKVEAQEQPEEVHAPQEDPDPLPDTPEPQQPETDLITQPQMRLMQKMFKETLGGDRATCLKFASATVGREITTTKELTKAEAGQVIDALEADGAPDAAEAEPFDGDDPWAVNG